MLKKFVLALALPLLLAPGAASAQFSAAPDNGTPVKVTFLRLGNNANAIITEPVTPDPVRSKVGIVVSHPERINNFNYFIGRGLSQRGYRVMAINYYGPETSFYELLSPMGQGMKAMKAQPGIEKLVLAGHSTGAAEVSLYQDVAENGAKACTRPERIYKCDPKLTEGLVKADAVMILDGNSGGPERTLSTNPAFDPHNPKAYNEALDLFSARNGYNPATGGASYSPEFLKRYFAAAAARVNQVIDENLARLAAVEKGQASFTRDDQAVVEGRGAFSTASKPELAYIGLLSRSHAPHVLLKADGTRPVQIIPVIKLAEANRRPANFGKLDPEPELRTVRSYLSTAAVRLNADYHWTADNIYGVEWHSNASSLQGSIAGIRVPTLVMAASCAPHLVLLEIAYDRSPAADKEFVGVEGADHGFNPCKPEYGGVFQRAFDYVDGWLMKPGRLF